MSEDLRRELERAEEVLGSTRAAFLALSKDRLAVLTPTGVADPTLLAAVQAAVKAAKQDGPSGADVEMKPAAVPASNHHS